MFPSPSAEQLVGNINAVAHVLGTSTKTVRRRILDSDFPPPFRLSPRGMLLWRLEDVRAYVARKAGEFRLAHHDGTVCVLTAEGV